MALPLTNLTSWEGQVATPWTPVNETHAGLEQYAQIAVQSMALTAPPSATEGEAYIPAATATGAWAGLEEDLVYYINGGWETIPLQAGVLVYNLADSTLYVKTAGSPVFQEISAAGGPDPDTLYADVSDNLTAGFTTTSYNAGSKSSGTFTPDPTLGNIQHATNAGAHTLAPPSNSCTIIIQYTNASGAGTITTSGFTVVDGDSLTTTVGHDFLFYITKANGFSHLSVKALQ